MRFKNFPYRSEEEASQFLDKMRWPDGITCPKCGNAEMGFYDMAWGRGTTSKKSPKGKIRFGLRKCRACRLEFRSTYGTPFHSMKVPLDILLAAIVLLNDRSSISATALSKELGIKRDTVARLFAAVRANRALRIRRGINQRDLTLEPLANPASAVSSRSP